MFVLQRQNVFPYWSAPERLRWLARVHVFPSRTVLDTLIYGQLGWKSSQRGLFCPVKLLRILCPWPLFSVRKSDTEVCWDCITLSHLLGFCREIWGLACHVFSQNTNGSWPITLVLVFFFSLHKIAYFSLQMGVRGSSEVFFFPCCLHTICGLLASQTVPRLPKMSVGQHSERSSP